MITSRDSKDDKYLQLVDICRRENLHCAILITHQPDEKGKKFFNIMSTDFEEVFDWFTEKINFYREHSIRYYGYIDFESY